MFKNVLAALDSSPYARGVMDASSFWAKKFSSRIKVLHIIDVRLYEWSVSLGMDGFTSVLPSATYQEESRKLLEQRADEVLKRASEPLKSKKISFEILKEYGPPTDVIIEKGKFADLIIMGFKGEFARWSSKFLGAVTETVSRQLEKPILFTRTEFAPPKKIMLAYDGSENSIKALSYAGSIAEKLSVPLMILTVHDDDIIAKEIQNEAVSYLRSFQIIIEERISGGLPENQIPEKAKDENVGLIVMGGYGHSRIREEILGSTTIQVMRKSEIPILLVK